ncbi:MAG: LPS export ABC transporter permease LptF [Alphaproteobacteria bacterium]
MPRCTRYIVQQLVGALLIVALGLTGVIWLSQSLRFIDLIINRGLSFFRFLELTLLLLPTFLALILPIALFSAVLYTYYRLIIDSELVVLRAAGLSQWTLAWPALILAGAVAAVAYSVTLYFMPTAFRDFKDMQFTIRSDYSQLFLREGTFNTLVEGLTVYVRARKSNGEVVGILVHDNRDATKPVTMIAERGAFVRAPEGPRFVLVNGNRQEVSPDSGWLSLLYFDRYTLDLSSFAEPGRHRWREPRERFLDELFGPPRVEEDVRFAGKLRAEGHQRLVAPLYCFVFALIALAALMSGEFNQRNQWKRVLAAIGAAVLFQVLGLALSHAVVKAPVLVPAMYANVAVVAGISLFILLGRRAPRRQALAAVAGEGR